MIQNLSITELKTLKDKMEDILIAIDDIENKNYQITQAELDVLLDKCKCVIPDINKL